MVGKFLRLAAQLVAFDRLREGHETRRTGLEGAAATERIGLVGDPTTGNGLAVQTVALVVVDRRQRCVDRDLVEVGPAQPGDLGVHVRMDAPSQQRIVAEVDAGHHMGGAEGDLLGLGEEIVGVAVEHHAPDRCHRHQLLGDQLGGVEHIEAEGFGLGLGEDLQAELPFRVFAGFDGVPQVAAVEVGIGAGDLDRLVPHQRMGAELGRPVELDEVRLARALTRRKVCTPKPCIIR